MAVWTEFQPLKSVILGNLFPTDELLAQLKLRGKWADAFKYINDQSLIELEKISDLLISRNIDVKRPKHYSISSSEGPAGPSLSPRDWLMVYGDVALQGNDAFANHNIRTFSTLGIHSIETISMPTYDVWADVGFNDLEYMKLQRPYFHTANMLRCGHDIFYSSNDCRTGNDFGFQWMVSEITKINPKARFHAVDTEEHLDGSISFVRPGLLLSNISKDRLPRFFDKWDVLVVDESDMHAFYRDTLAYKWKKLNPIVAKDYAWFMQTNPQETCFSINGLSLDENTIIFPGINPSLFRRLERLGIECLTVSMRAISFWDSGLHCCTSELARSGDLEDYS